MNEYLEPTHFKAWSWSEFLVYFDSGKLRYSHRFADLFSGAPRICLFFSNDQLNSDLLCRKMETGRKFFDVSSLLVTDYLPDPAVGKKSTRTKKEKPPLVQFRRGEALLRFQITGSQYSQKCSCSLPCNTFFDPIHFVFVNSTEKYFFEKRLLCKQECIWPKSTKIHTPAQKEAGKYLIPENWKG